MKEGLIEQLRTVRQFFLNTISCLTQEDSNYAPKEEMYTVAQQIGHTAHTVGWFMDGAFGPNGFDMNFENYVERMKKYTSLKQGVEEFEHEVERAIHTIEKTTNAELMAPDTCRPDYGWRSQNGSDWRTCRSYGSPSRRPFSLCAPARKSSSNALWGNVSSPHVQTCG